jgi:DHA2 family multidrug resistance protein
LSDVLDSGEELNPFRWIILVGLITAAVLEILDTTIVNVALPNIAGNLGATNEEVAWVATGYILSNVIVLPMTAWLSSRFGRRKYLTGSIVLFVGASALCGISTSLHELVLWRILQGAGGAALLSTSQSTLREIFPATQQGIVQSIYILGVIVAPTVGPTLGGYLTDNYSWPMIFFVNIPIGMVSATIVGTFLQDARHRMDTIKIDFLGIGLLALGLGSLQYVLEEGNRRDWFEDSSIIAFSCLSALALGAMVAWELAPANRYPVVNFRVLKNRELSTALILFLALGFGLYGGTFLFPLFAQQIVGFTPTATGLALMPGGIATGVSAIMCGILLNRAEPLVKPRYLILTGMAIFVWSMYDLSRMTPESGQAETWMALLLRGAALGMLFTPINLAALSGLKGLEIPQGVSLMNLMRQLGGSFGIAILNTYVLHREALHYSLLMAHVYPGNPSFDAQVGAMRAGLQGRVGEAAQAGLRLLAFEVHQQALSMSFNDAFLLIGVSVVAVSPLVLLLRYRKPGAGGPPAAADMH